jgi:hypothetical protein
MSTLVADGIGRAGSGAGTSAGGLAMGFRVWTARGLGSARGGVAG